MIWDFATECKSRMVAHMALKKARIIDLTWHWLMPNWQFNGALDIFFTCNWLAGIGQHWPTGQDSACLRLRVCISCVSWCVCVCARAGVPISLSINLNELLALRSDVSLDGLPTDPRSVVYFLLDGGEVQVQSGKLISDEYLDQGSPPSWSLIRAIDDGES